VDHHRPHHLHVIEDGGPTAIVGTPSIAADGGYREPELKPLSEVIDELNDRFGLDLGSSDQILVFQQVVGLVEDTSMQQIALMNDEARLGRSPTTGWTTSSPRTPSATPTS
jgi:hypothetical protein